MSEAVRRTARMTRCQCGDHLLVGLDSHRAALTARVDIYPLNELGEVRAMQAGRRTFRLHNKELDPRDQWTIRATPASATTVLAEHRCGESVPAQWRRPITPPTTRRTVDAEF